jgi:hypothetical protein
MSLLDLINPYPISDRLFQSPRDTPEDLDERSKNLRTIREPIELARIMANSHGDNSLPNALHESLETNKAYLRAKKLTPFLKDAPAISNYRKRHSAHDAAAVIREIVEADIYMPAGQILFHGGPWPGILDLPEILAECYTSRPLSTTLCPQVAAVHSRYEPRGFIWAITLHSDTPCFVFNNKNPTLGHEYEVLLPPIQIICQKIETKGLRIPLIHVTAKFSET